MSNLRLAFDAYQGKTKAVFQEAKDTDFQSGKDQLVSSVKKLENKNHELYTDLLYQTSNRFSNNYQWDIEEALKNFLRRSSFYLVLFEGEVVEPGEYVDALNEAFDKIEDSVDIWYIVPIEGVRLKDQITINEDFEIARLNEKEWEQKLNNKPNKYFYPKSHLDTDILWQYDCCVIRKKVPFRDLRSLDYSFNSNHDYISFNYSGFQSVVEEKIGQLILPEWKRGEIKSPSFNHELRFPVVIKKHNSLINPPYHQPDMFTSLDVELGYSEDSESQVPDYPWRFSFQEFKPPESEDLVNSLQVSSEVIDIIKANPSWNFIKNALQFFTKAYTSYGYEQLLWYITTMDTLLGEGDKENFRINYEQEFDFPAKLIAYRGAFLNNRNHVNETYFVNRYLELNRLRNDLIHGIRDLSNDQSLKRKELAWLHDKVRICIVEVLNLLRKVYKKGAFSNFRGRNVPSKTRILELIHVTYRPRMDLSIALKKDLQVDYDWLFDDGKII